MKRPPNILEGVLECLLRYEDYETILGDFAQQYNCIIENRGTVIGFLWYIFQIFTSAPKFVKSQTIWSAIMLKSYFLSAVRNINKYKGFSFINILGLALSISVCLFIIKMIVFFSSFDCFHENSDRIYKITTNLTTNSGVVYHYDTTPPPLASVLQNDCPDVEKTAVVGWCNHNILVSQNRALSARNVFADQGFFELFTIDKKYGNYGTFLTEPNSIVITDKTAERFFGAKNPVGQIMHNSELGDLIVTGVICEIPHNSEFHEIEALVSYPTLIQFARSHERYSLESWTQLAYPNQNLYFQISENSNITSIYSFLKKITGIHIRSDRYTWNFSIIPIRKIVFEEELNNSDHGMKMPRYILFFLSLIGLVILATACFNYTNLSAAKSLTRLRDIGIRKVIGAQRGQLFVQFVSESIVLTVLAFIAAIFLHRVIITLFFDIHPKMSLMFKFTETPVTYLIFIFFALFTGIVAGLLPAFYLSRLRPMDILSHFSRFNVLSKIGIRKVLIVFQLAFSFFFLLATMSAYKQFRFVRQFDLGFNYHNVVNVNLRPQQYEQFKRAISSSYFVSGISACGYKPGTTNSRSLMARKASSSDSLRLYYLPVDEHFINNLGLRLIAGENFPQSINRAHESFVIINETAVERLGFANPAGAIGETILLGYRNAVTIIGVVNDFTIYAYHRSMQPLALRYLPDEFYYANIRVQNIEKEDCINYLEKRWSELYPFIPFVYEYYIDEIERKTFMHPKITFQVGSFISVLSITIAFLGLLGISIYTVETKTKEIGIRKVLGAGMISIVRFLTKEYLLLTAIATVIVAPIVLYLHNLALRELANKADLTILDIGFGICLMFLIGFFTIIAQIIKALRVNPVETLQHE